MIIPCPNCDARLQLEDDKVPAGPFTVRCMKCQRIINAQPPAKPKDMSALNGTGALPPPAGAVSGPLSHAPAGATVSEVPGASLVSSPPPTPAPDENNLMRMLAALLRQAGAAGEGGDLASPSRPGKPKRRVMVCVGAGRIPVVERALASGHYEIVIADGTAHAIERVRSGKMNVVVLDAEFDAVEQGAVFVNREINVMRPAERRRLYAVHLSPTARTADAHAAFINNVNLVVNFSDAADLPRLLEQGIADVNDLYRDFNSVLNLPAL